MATRTGSSYELALQDQITALGARMEKSFDEVKQMLLGYDARLRDLEKQDVRETTANGINMNAAWKRLDEHSLKIKTAQDELTQLRETTKALNWLGKWILGIFTTMLTLILTLLITGKAEIIFK